MHATLNKGKSGKQSNYPDKYNYVPQDFKYDNKHYKYIKYTKFSMLPTNAPFTLDKHHSHNEVLDTKTKFGAKGTPNWNKGVAKYWFNL